MKRPIPLTAIMLVLSLSGCASWKMPSMKMPWTREDKSVAESKYTAPARLAVVWTDTVLTHPTKPATRGFGGRFYFFNNQGQAVPVDGQLVVYAYDDTEKQPGNRPPDRRYAFTPEQFTQHFSETEIGASYSVWIPWDEAGGAERKISLLPVFASTTGQRVVGDQTENVLPGRGSQVTGVQQVALERRQTNFDTSVQQIGFEQPAGAEADAKAAGTSANSRTTTISVPRTMSRSLNHHGQPATPTHWVPASGNPAGNPGHAASLPATGSHAASEPPTANSRLTPAQRVTRFERTGFQAPRGPIGRLGLDPGRTSPSH